MKKKEYLDQLERLLADISPEERQAAIEYFTDYLEDAGPDGEQEVMEHLGSPADVAAAVKEGLGNDNGTGRFTENGYESGMEASRYAVVKAGQMQKKTKASENRYAKRDRRKERRGLGWLLVLIGAVICVGIPLVSVLGSVFAAVVAAVAAVGIGGFALALGLAAAGVILIVLGITKVAGATGMGLMLMGCGFLCFAFAALALAAGVWMWRTVIPWAARSFQSVFRRIFRRERSRG